MDSFGPQVDLWTRYWAGLADPARVAVLDATAVAAGTVLLDIGCGSGDFARLATDRGARVSGIDVAAEMIAMARDAVPEADLRTGEMTDLPWPDASFDVVTAFNAFQFVDDPLQPLTEAVRVRREGGRIAICNWGYPKLQQNARITDALKTLLPVAPPPRTTTVSEPGALEALVERAGLRLDRADDVEVPWEVGDQTTLVAAAQLTVQRLGVVEHADEAAIEATILDAAAPFRRPDGSYRLENRWRYVVAV